MFWQKREKGGDNMPNKTSSADLPWMTGKEMGEFRKEFTSPDPRKNVIYSKDICVSLDSKEGGPNLNSVVIGGSGSGKSVCVIVPNLLQADTSYVVTDPDGFLYEEYGSYLQYMGYHVKCLNLIDMDRSDCYNPFTYIQGDEDIEALVETLVKNAETFQSQDLYYAKCESLLLCALVAYLHDHCRPADQNFANVLRLLHDMHTDGDGPESFSPVDTLFEAVRKEDPDAYAVRQYDRFKLGAGKALKPVILAAALHLKMFDSEKDGSSVISAEEFFVYYMQGYLAGVQNCTESIQTYIHYNSSVDLATLFNDLFYNVPIISHFTTENACSIYFSKEIGFDDQVLPLVGNGLMYFGYFLSPALLILTIKIVLIADRKYRYETNILGVYVFSYISIQLSFCHYQNIQLIMLYLTCRILPIWLIYKFVKHFSTTIKYKKNESYIMQNM